MPDMADGPRQAPPRIADDVVFRELDGEAVILHLGTGLYYGLDPVGTRIWQLLERRQPMEGVVSALTAEYDVDAATARADVLRLLDALCHKGLLVSDDGPAA